VRAPERFVQFGPALGFRNVFQQRQNGADMFQMLGMLAAALTFMPVDSRADAKASVPALSAVFDEE